MIRKYQETDKQSVVEIYNGSKLDELKYEERTFELIPLDRDSVRFSLIFDSSILVFENVIPNGFVAFKDGVINGLYVNPTYRGKGIGKDLLKAALGQIKGPASLQVTSSNKLAKQLYSKMGFQIIGEYSLKYNGISVQVNRMVTGF